MITKLEEGIRVIGLLITNGTLPNLGHLGVEFTLCIMVCNFQLFVEAKLRG